MIVVQKIIQSFLLPPGFFVTVPLLLGLIWLKNSRKKAFMILSFALFNYVLTTSLGTFLFVRSLERSFTRSDPLNCDAVVVLGGGIVEGPEGYELRPHSFKRLVEGVMLAKKYDALLIVSGGSLPGSSRRAEAFVMAELARKLGVLEEKLLLDSESKNTHENAKNVSSMARKLNLREVVLVTSAVHMKRAVKSFEKFEFVVHPYPVDYLCDHSVLDWTDFIPTRESLQANMLGLHEIVGLLWYRLM